MYLKQISLLLTSLLLLSSTSSLYTENDRVIFISSQSFRDLIYVVRCTVQFKNVKNIHGGVLLLVKLQAKFCNFTKSNTPPWMFSRFLNCTNGTKSCNASHICIRFNCCNKEAVEFLN